MNKKIHNFFGNLFLSATALCWMSCDSSSSTSPVSIPDENPTSSSDLPALSSSDHPTSSNDTESSPSTESSSDAASSSSIGKISDSKDFINIDEELSKLTPPDTTGLRGQCISEQQHCETIENYNAYFNDAWQVEVIAREKRDSILKDSASFSSYKLKCYKDLIEQAMAPVYGVSWCSNPNREKNTDETCETEGQIRIDEEYLKALQDNYNAKRTNYQKIFEDINEKAKKCEISD